MTNPRVPTVQALRGTNDNFYLRVDRADDYQTLVLNNVTDERVAEQIAAYARGMIADAFDAGRAEAEALASIEPMDLSVGAGAQLVTERDEARQQRDLAHDALLRVGAEHAEAVQARDALMESLDQAHERERQLQNRITELEGNDHDATAELRGLNESLEARVGSLTASVRGYHHDLEVTWDRLLQEAEERDWCSDFDRIRDELANQMSQFDPPIRAQDYEGHIRLDFSALTVRRSDGPDNAVSEMSQDIFRYVQRTYPNLFDDFHFDYEEQG